MARNLRIWILQYTKIMTSDLEGEIPIFFFRAQAPLKFLHYERQVSHFGVIASVP